MEKFNLNGKGDALLRGSFLLKFKNARDLGMIYTPSSVARLLRIYTYISFMRVHYILSIEKIFNIDRSNVLSSSNKTS